MIDLEKLRCIEQDMGRRVSGVVNGTEALSCLDVAHWRERLLAFIADLQADLTATRQAREEAEREPFAETWQARAREGRERYLAAEARAEEAERERDEARHDYDYLKRVVLDALTNRCKQLEARAEAAEVAREEAVRARDEALRQRDEARQVARTLSAIKASEERQIP